jgi:phosphohistidine phosphatase SixA
LRPLDARGRRQAEGLVEQLRGWAPSRILSSPYVRCRETVEPLAEVLGLAVEDATELEEGSSAEVLRGFVAKLGEGVVVLCTHGDVVEDVLGEESKKGSTWSLELEGDEFARVAYLPPPA